MLFTISMQLQNYITPVDQFNIIIKTTVSPFFFHVMLVCIKKKNKQTLLYIQISVINLYLCFLIQNAIFDYTIPHNKSSSLVLPRGQLFCLAPYRICVDRNSLLHILLTLIIKNALLYICNLHLLLDRNSTPIFLLSVITQIKSCQQPGIQNLLFQNEVSLN